MGVIFTTTLAHADDAPVTEQPSTAPLSTLSGWKAQYWGNLTQSGIASLERTDPSIDFNWQLAAADDTLPIDEFSARWTRSTSLLAGRFRITVLVTGGARVRIDNQVIVNYYHNQGHQNITSYVNLSSGVHLVEVDYVDRGGQARIKFDLQRMAGIADTLPNRIVKPNVGQSRFWQGDYFNNITLSGVPAYSEKHANIDFNWGEKSPALAIKRDGFSARFSKRAYFNSGTYNFVVRADENIRIFIDNKLIVNEWLTKQNRISQTTSVNIHQGWHDIRIEYADIKSVANLHVHWELQ